MRSIKTSGRGLRPDSGLFGCSAFPSQDILADLIHVPRADGEHDIPRRGYRAQGVLKLVEGRAEHCAVDLICERGGGDADGVLLARCEYLREQQHVGAAQLLHKIVKQRGGAGIGVRLEHDDRALVVEVLDRVEQRLELARMVGVIVIDVRAVVLALELEAAGLRR